MSVGRVGVEESVEGSADDAVDGDARRGQAIDGGYALIPVVLMVILSFRAGGYFPGPTAVAVVAIGVVLVMRVALSKHPFAGLSTPSAVGALLLGLLALWTLASGTWSHAPARAVLEFDRVLLYTLVFVLLAAWGRTPQRLRWIVRAIVAGAFAVCLCGLVTRLLPDVWEIAPAVANERLSYPLTYWNSLGLLAAVGLILSCALTSDDREHPLGRVLTAAALPILATTLYLTFSRGAIAAALAGLAALIVAGRPRALPSGLLAAGPTVALAVLSAYGADLLATDRPTTAAATSQGHTVAVVVVLCTVLAALARTRLLRLDARWAGVAFPAILRRRRLTWSVGLAVAASVAIAAGLAGAAGEQYERFVDDTPDETVRADNRARITTFRDNGRFLYWRVALENFAQQPLNGEGAGTYHLRWSRRGRSSQFDDAHSLYAEVTGELGVVGLSLVIGTLLLVLGGFLARARGPDRVVGAGLFAAGLAWALHAGVDWDWEMPAVTLWFFAAGGVALAAPSTGSEVAGSGARTWAMKPITRATIALGCVAVLLVPLLVYRSDVALGDSVRAFARGDCATAMDRARASSATLDVRPEPHLITGYCEVRRGHQRRAVHAMQEAVDREPENWEGHYGVALARAAAGLDPRPAARTAARLRPWDPLPAQALRLFDTDDPRQWRRRAPAARVPVD